MVLGLVIGSGFVPEQPGAVLPAIGMLLSALPAVAWLAFLYRVGARMQFHLSLLPFTLFFLAALLSAAATRPFLHDIINVDVWLGRTTTNNRLLGEILLNGFTHAFMLYAIVRYVAWSSLAFVRRTDGVMYAMAASWGYAAVFNALYVIDLGQPALLSGGLRLLAHLCTFLSTALILGYFLGRNRFENMPVYYLGSGLIFAAVVNGFLLYAGSALNSTRLGLTQSGFSPWPGLALNVAVLALAYSTVYGLTQRQNALTKARLEQGIE
jgi:RsiW-degrading membrane proteinase PrsW (M82 family)